MRDEEEEEEAAAFALVDGSAPLHTMSLNSIQTHGSAMWWWVAGVWHPSWVPLPVLGTGKIFFGHGVRGLASPDLLLGAIPWCAVPQIMEDVEVIQHVPTAVEQIVESQCHRSCRLVVVKLLVRCTSTGAVLGQGC